MEIATIEKFTYEIESNAIVDIFSTAGEEEVNKDNFEVLSNKNLTILILASGKGRSNIGDILSEMASSQALDILDKYQFHKKTPTEIIEFLKEIFFTINDTLVEYLEVSNIKDASTTLSIAVIFKNSLYTAHIGENRIYLIPRDETPTLLSKDPSYSKRISKNSLSSQESSYYLGDLSLKEEQVFITNEATLYHKDTIFLCSNSMLDTIPENKFTKDAEEIKGLINKNPPLESASFLRYLHYERSIEVLRVDKEDMGGEATTEYEYETEEIDWEKITPILKQISLALGVFIIVFFVYLLLSQDSTTGELYNKEINQSKNLTIENEKRCVPEQNFIVEKDHPIIQEKNNSIEKKEESLPAKKIIPIQPNIQNTPKIEKLEKLKSETLKVLHKAESDILYTDTLRITFKGNQLIASKKDLFYEKDKSSQMIYCSLKTTDSELKGELIDELQKQYYSDSVVVKTKGKNINIKIKIKRYCHYTRSNWAKESGLDLLTFECKEP